jgi:nicotinate-nucleotide adenylyltransferase
VTPVTSVAIFGGSFNPPHVSHVLAATYVLSTEPIDRVLVVPTFQHPFGKPLAPFDDRVRMCELAMGWIPGVEVSRVEETLGGESRTVRTLEHLKKTHPEWEMRFMIGADIVAESHKWFAFERIIALAPPIVLGRIGVIARESGPQLDALGPVPPPVLPDISSTDVRAKFASGAYAELAPLVPRAVIEHARSHGLYR